MPTSLLPQPLHTIFTAGSLDDELGRVQEQEEGQGHGHGCVAESVSPSSSVPSSMNTPERNSESKWKGVLFGSFPVVVDEPVVAACGRGVSSSVPSLVVDHPFSVVASKSLKCRSDDPDRIKGGLKSIEAILHIVH